MSDDADPDSTSIVQPPGHRDPEKTQVVHPANHPTMGQQPSAQSTPPPLPRQAPTPPSQAGPPFPPPPHYPPPQQFGTAPPFGAPQAGPGMAGQYPGAGFSGIPSPTGPPGAPQSPGELAGQLVAKGTTVIARLMQRGMRGELIKSAWFQAFRNSPDQFMTVAYIIVAVLALLMAYGGALFGAIVYLALWAALAYVFFAIGTLRAHKLVAYGIGYGGAAIALLGAVQPAMLLVSLSSYSLTSIKVGLVFEIAIAAITASVLGAFGFLVGKEIKRLSTTPF